jgi:phosphoglycolate phosphatase
MQKDPLYRVGIIQAIIFDLDGTLLNTLEDIGNAVNRVLLKRGYPIHPLDTYRFFVGDGWEMLIKRALPESESTHVRVRECVDESKVVYGKTWDNTTTPYEGIPELLNHLAQEDIRLAVFSNKPQFFARQCVDKLLAAWRFEKIIGFSSRFPKKPDPAGALSIMSALNLDKKNCIYIGDSGVDMQTAAAAGIFSVGAAWGFRPETELMEHGCQFLAKHPMDVISLMSRR